MFDKLGSKEDAATICLHGKRVPREIKTLSEDELLAQHVTGYDASITGVEDHEDEVQSHWAGLRDKFLTITRNEDLGITKSDQDAVAALLEEMEDYS